MTIETELAIVATCNDEESFARNLMASPIVANGVPLHVERAAPSAAIAYNRGLDATRARYVLFVHQDVYLPPRFADDLAAAIRAVEVEDPDWGVIAPFGMSADGVHLGSVWSTSQGARIGREVERPHPVVSVDELAFLLRRNSGLRFDEDLPGWHLYGTEIVQTARAAGRGAYVAPLPMVHNDKFHARLGADFTRGYHFVRRKWRHAMPLRTPVLWIRRHGLDLPFYRFRAWRSLDRRRAKAGDVSTDPRVFSAVCGWEGE